MTAIQRLAGNPSVEAAAKAHATLYGRWETRREPLMLKDYPLGTRNVTRFCIRHDQSSFVVDSTGIDLPHEVEVYVEQGEHEEYVKARRHNMWAIVGSGPAYQGASYVFQCPLWGEPEVEEEEAPALDPSALEAVDREKAEKALAAFRAATNSHTLDVEG